MESAAAAPQACAAAISTATDKMRQKTDPGNDFDLSDESSSFNLEQLSASMTGEGRLILNEALRRFADGQPSEASTNPSAPKRRADEVE